MQYNLRYFSLYFLALVQPNWSRIGSAARRIFKTRFSKFFLNIFSKTKRNIEKNTKTLPSANMYAKVCQNFNFLALVVFSG